MIYTRLVKPLLFRLDPERSHDLALTSLALAGRMWRSAGTMPAADPRLAVDVCGLRFRSPLGLAGEPIRRRGRCGRGPTWGSGLSRSARSRHARSPATRARVCTGFQRTTR